MNRKQSSKIITALLCFCWVCMLFSCGSSQKATVPKQDGLQLAALSPEQQRKFDYFFMEAVKLKERGSLDEAFEVYNHCLEINPTSAVTLFELSKYYMYLQQYDRGEDALVKAVALEPSNYWYKNTLAIYYQNKGETEKAIDVMEGMVERFPSRLEPLMALVDLYTRSQDYAKAIHTLNRLEKLDGKSEQISMQKFRMYLLTDNMEQAFLEIENLAKEYPYDMRYLTILGDVYLDNGKADEAYETYEKVLAKEPGYAPVMLSLLAYYERTGKDSLYRAQLDTVLMNEQVGTDTKMNIMRQLIMRSEQTDKDSTRIMKLFKGILSQEQPTAELPMLAAQYYLTKKMDKEAVPVLHQVLEIDPENTPARLQLLSFALTGKDFKEAVRICKPGMEYTPEVLEYYYYGGLSYYELKEGLKALELFRKGTRQITDQTDKEIASDLYAIMGDLYHSQNQKELSYAAYDSSLVYKDDNIGALNNYAYFLSKDRVNLDKAEEMSYKTVKAEPKNSTYLDTYAWILFQKGKYAEARIYIDQAIQNDGGKGSVVVEHGGDIYYLAGDKEKAVELWKQAEKIAKEADGEDADKRSEEEMKLLQKKITHKKYFTE